MKKIAKGLNPQYKNATRLEYCTGLGGFTRDSDNVVKDANKYFKNIL